MCTYVQLFFLHKKTGNNYQLQLHISTTRVFLLLGLQTGFIGHQSAGESSPCSFFKTDLFEAYGAVRAVHCTLELFCLLLKL